MTSLMPIAVTERPMPNFTNSLPTFDLTLVRNHMIRRHELDEPSAMLAESEYRKYLAKCKANPGQNTAPGQIADKFWHAHILHTLLYTQHCMQYFGYYLHHTPKVKPVTVLCAEAECFCNDVHPGDINKSGGGFSMKAAFAPSKACGKACAKADCEGTGGGGGDNDDITKKPLPFGGDSAQYGDATSIYGSEYGHKL